MILICDRSDDVGGELLPFECPRILSPQMVLVVPLVKWFWNMLGMPLWARSRILTSPELVIGPVNWRKGYLVCIFSGYNPGDL